MPQTLPQPEKRTFLVVDDHALVLGGTPYDGDEDIYRGLRAGAKGYLLKDADLEELLEAIRTVHRGQTCIPPAVGAKLVQRMVIPQLSDRELKVLRLIATGKGMTAAALSALVLDRCLHQRWRQSQNAPIGFGQHFQYQLVRSLKTLWQSATRGEGADGQIAIPIARPTAPAVASRGVSSSKNLVS